MARPLKEPTQSRVDAVTPAREARVGLAGMPGVTVARMATATLSGEQQPEWGLRCSLRGAALSGLRLAEAESGCSA